MIQNNMENVTDQKSLEGGLCQAKGIVRNKLSVIVPFA